MKYRKALLAEDVVEILVEATRGIAERYDMEFEWLVYDRDHIHSLCSAYSKIAPGQIVRVFKSSIGREVFQRNPALNTVLWGGQFWG